VPWLFHGVGNVPDRVPYVQPAGPIDSWKVDDLKDWLRARDLKVGGLKPELLQRVHDLINQPGGPHGYVSI
jgi:hypothetical protein